MLFETERPTKLSEIVGRDKEITQIKAMIEKPAALFGKGAKNETSNDPSPS